MNALNFNKQSLTNIAFLLEVAAMFVDGLLGGAFESLSKSIIHSNRSILEIIFSAIGQFLMITIVSRLVLEFMGMDISFLLEMGFYFLENHKSNFLFVISLLFMPIFRISITWTTQAIRLFDAIVSLIISIVAKTHTECSISHILTKIKLYKSLKTNKVVFGTSIGLRLPNNEN